MAASGQSLFDRVRADPGNLVKAATRLKKDGLSAVRRKVQSIQDATVPVGYSAAGVVAEVGRDIEGIARGDRVAVAGAAYAFHAGQLAVPVNLSVPIPLTVSFEDASTVALGAIALQGVRRAGVGLGEIVGVMGCGAIGLLTVQLLKAAGCRVIAFDLDAHRLALARELGADLAADAGDEDLVNLGLRFSEGRGLDAVVLTLTTPSNEPLLQAFRMSRRRGRVVLVGVVGKEFNRDEMYAKELDFVISTSYGPGRYDEGYERWGVDYPYEYVRWAERRNMQSYLELVAAGKVRLSPLLGAAFPVEQAVAAYAAFMRPDRPVLVTLSYGDAAERSESVAAGPVDFPATGVWHRPATDEPVTLAILGAGQFVRGVHAPILAACRGVAVRHAIARTGISAREASSLFPGCLPGTDWRVALADPCVHAVLIGTRHDTHAALATAALQANKAVFLEKPLCLCPAECSTIRKAVAATQAPFLVGYNRRFAPDCVEIKRLTDARISPLMIHYTMNAGALPPAHWLYTSEGGGRIVGEACHIFDLFRFLVGVSPVSVSVAPIRPTTAGLRPDENLSVTVTYADGSVATLLYTALGHITCPKERMEVFWDGKVLILDDYAVLTGHGCRCASRRGRQPDKGHAAEWKAFLDAVTAGEERFPIALDELVETWELSWMVAHLVSNPSTDKSGPSHLPLDVEGDPMNAAVS